MSAGFVLPEASSASLDDVFVTSRMGVRSVRTARSAGSDHRRVVAELVRTEALLPTR